MKIPFLESLLIFIISLLGIYYSSAASSGGKPGKNPATLHPVSLFCQFAEPAFRQDPYEYKAASPGGTGKFYLGREIAGIMGSAGAAWLERDSRQEEENSQAILRKLPIEPGSTVADVGAGTGYYTFQIAKQIPDGKIYAVDIQDEFIRRLEARKQSEAAKNVVVVKGDEKSPNLPPASLDLIILVDVYHELLFPREMLQALRQALKTEGRLLLIEYKAEDPTVAIKPLHKMTVAQVRRELQANGFKLIKQDDTLPIQHFLLFGKE